MSEYSYVDVAEKPYVASLPNYTSSFLTTVRQPTPDRYRVERVVLHRTYLQPKVELFNIPLTTRREGGHIHLECEQWPTISAFGESFQEAVGNLNGLIRDLVVEYVMVPEAQLAEDAIELRSYLISKLF